MDHKRITLFAGHYGSGKTNIAVNYALLLAREGRRTAIADLDIVNPYFRTKDSAAELAAAGVSLISQIKKELEDSFPRVCGGEPIGVTTNQDMVKFSPRVRG